MNLAIRGFLAGNRQFEQYMEVPESQLDQVIETLGMDHAHAMATGQLDMIEIEFLDIPDINERFFRIGTNPNHMVLPIKINL